LESNLLERDIPNDGIFFGRLAIDANPPCATRGVLPLAQRILGYNASRTKIYAIAVFGDTVNVLEYNPSTFALLTKRMLFRRSGEATPVFYYDSNTNDFFIAEFNYAVLRHYDLDNVSITSAGPVPTVPASFALYQNYPNPFNPSTRIPFSVPGSGLPAGQAGFVSLKVYDILGRDVATLVNENLPPGSYEVTFDASGLPSGVYFYRLTVRSTAGGQAAVFVETKKLVVMR
jgi:hypothetical protein